MTSALIIVFTLSGCRSGDSGDDAQGVAEAALTEQQIHVAVQDEIEQCMREQGFDYQRVPFSGSQDTASFISLADADEIGFRAAYFAFVTGVIRPEVPDDSLDIEATQAYSSALVGANDMSDDSGSSDNATPSSGGCRGQGEALQKRLVSELSTTGTESRDLDADLEILFTSPDWLELSESWYDCMERDGLNPRQHDPYQYAHETYFESSREARTAVANDINGGAADSYVYTEDFTYDDFHEALGEYPKLQKVYENEVQLATANRTCMKEAGLTEERIAGMLQDAQ